MKQRISRQRARNFLLAKQLLLPTRQLDGQQAVEQVFNVLRIIQYDPLNPCGRNVDLVLQARIANYHPNDYYEWLYQEKKGVEVYDKELCVIPIEDLLLVTHSWDRTRKHTRIKNFFKKYQTEIEELLQKINLDGPISSADIMGKLKVDSGWGTEALWGRMALEALWQTGRLVIVKRQNGRKYYDLPEKAFAHLESFPKNYQRIAREHIIRRIRSVGMLPKSGSGTGWLGMGTARETGAIILKLISADKLIEIEIEGVKQIYVINAEDEQLLNQKISKAKKPKMVFIAPLDNLIWDRQMIKNIFNFDYKWEVYVPAAKRKYGYYVLPILYGDKFVGRIEPVFRNGVLEIKGLWKEFKWDVKMEQAYKEALEEFKKYLNIDKIVGLKQITP